MRLGAYTRLSGDRDAVVRAKVIYLLIQVRDNEQSGGCLPTTLKKGIFLVSPIEQRSSVFSCPGHANMSPGSILGKCLSYSNRQLIGTAEEDKTYSRRMTKAQELFGIDGRWIFAIRDTGEFDFTVNEVRKRSISDLKILG